jgi:serine/threonine protein kinase
LIEIHSGKGVDWWCLGVFLYELNAGFSPFYAPDHAALYSLILRCGSSQKSLFSVVILVFLFFKDYKFPKHFKDDLKSLIRQLLQMDTTKRFGCLAHGAQDIKNHAYFQRINWLALYEKKVHSEYKPPLVKGHEYDYFEEKKDFTVAKASTCLYEKEFQEF